MTHATGFSEEALFVDSVSKANMKGWTTSATFTKSPAYDDMWDVKEECKEENWDCHGASPVEQDTFRNAFEFIEALPLGYPLPSIGAEPDGHITFEWYRNPQCVLSVSIGPEGVLHYAALLGLSDSRGAEPFYNETPESILGLIRRVIRA